MSVETKGFDELHNKLGKLGDLTKLAPSLQAAAVHIKGTVDNYPPSTIANRPMGPGSRWYKRGTGAMYWRKGDNRKVSYGGSEDMKHKWTIKAQNRGLTQIVGNNVSYGPYVQSREKQAMFHRNRGWKTIEDVVYWQTPTVLNFIQREIDRILAE